MGDRGPAERTLGCTWVGEVRVAVDCADLVRVDDPQAVDRREGDVWVELAELLGARAAATVAPRVLILEREGVRFLLAVPTRVTLRTLETSAVTPVPPFVDGLRRLGVGELFVDSDAVGYVLGTPDLARATTQERRGR